MTLAHPTITLSALQATNSPYTTITPITLTTPTSHQPPYQLVWVRDPNGNTRLYRLIPDPPPLSNPQPPQPKGSSNV